MKIERNARVLCWDETLIDQQYGVRVEQHKPVKKNIALRCDDEWEGVHNGYAAVMKTDDGYRLYYCAHTAIRLIILNCSIPVRSVRIPG